MKNEETMTEALGLENGAAGATAQPQPSDVKVVRGRITTATQTAVPKDGEDRPVTFFSLDDPTVTFSAWGPTSFSTDEIPHGSEVEVVYTDWVGTSKQTGAPVVYHNLRSRPRVLALAPQTANDAYPDLDAMFGPCETATRPTAAYEPVPYPAGEPFRGQQSTPPDKDASVERLCSNLRKAGKHLANLVPLKRCLSALDRQNIQTRVNAIVRSTNALLGVGQTTGGRA